MAWLFHVMFLLAAGLATYLLLTRLVDAQPDQIGTLRASHEWRCPWSDLRGMAAQAI